MKDNLGNDFDKADVILAKALTQFQVEKISQHVWGMALLEIGISALVKLDEDEKSIVQLVKEFIKKSKN